MDTNDEIRLQRLRQLCRETDGGVRAVASKAGLNWQTLDQIIKRVPLPPKADGTTSPRNVGSALARQIEESFDLGEGWFDWPFEGVDFKQWKALNEAQRIYVQGRLGEAVRDAAKIARSDDALDARWMVPNAQSQPQRPSTKNQGGNNLGFHFPRTPPIVELGS
jgi:hypothetical protein